MKRAPHWTPEQTVAAVRLHAGNASNAQCIAEIGRTRVAVNTRAARERMLERQAAVILDQKLRAAEIDRQLAERVADAKRRLTAPRSLTSFVFGDPAPGVSALDRRLATTEAAR